MGGLQSLPNFDLKFSSNYCNEQTEDDMDGRKKSRRFSWLRKINESSTENEKTDQKMVIESTGLQSEQTNVEKISNKSI